MCCIKAKPPNHDKVAWRLGGKKFFENFFEIFDFAKSFFSAARGELSEAGDSTGNAQLR